ncbi:MAG: hypothetical protein ACK4S4_05060 [Pyrinomonadaceae bacterium]
MLTTEAMISELTDDKPEGGMGGMGMWYERGVRSSARRVTTSL